jgi:hypothetical protein
MALQIYIPPPMRNLERFVGDTTKRFTEKVFSKVNENESFVSDHCSVHGTVQYYTPEKNISSQNTSPWNISSWNVVSRLAVRVTEGDITISHREEIIDSEVETKGYDMERYAKIIEIMSEFNLGIICTQETDSFLFDMLSNQGCSVQFNEDGKNSARGGLMCFLSNPNYEFAKLSEPIYTTWIKSDGTNGRRTIGQRNWIRNKSTNNIICVINIHLPAGLDKYKRSYSEKDIDVIIEQSQNNDIIVGDFNLRFHFITNKLLAKYKNVYSVFSDKSGVDHCFVVDNN